MFCVDCKNFTSSNRKCPNCGSTRLLSKSEAKTVRYQEVLEQRNEAKEIARGALTVMFNAHERDGLDESAWNARIMLVARLEKLEKKT